MVTGGSRSDFSLGATDATRRMSASGTFRTSNPHWRMSVIGGKADMARTYQYVRLWPKADICSNSGHEGLCMGSPQCCNSLPADLGTWGADI